MSRDQTRCDRPMKTWVCGAVLLSKIDAGIALRVGTRRQRGSKLHRLVVTAGSWLRPDHRATSHVTPSRARRAADEIDTPMNMGVAKYDARAKLYLLLTTGIGDPAVGLAR